MSKKSETIRIGLLTALIAFAAIVAFAVVVAPGDGITIPAHAFRDVQPGDIPYAGHGTGHEGWDGTGGFNYPACNIRCFGFG